jgi:hypothetical protein
MRVATSQLHSTASCMAMSRLAIKKVHCNISHTLPPSMTTLRNAEILSFNQFATSPGAASLLSPPSFAQFFLSPFYRRRRCPSPLEIRAMSASPGPGEPRFKVLTVDIGGTFLKTAQPVPEAYASIGKKYGEPSLYTLGGDVPVIHLISCTSAGAPRVSHT